MHELGVLKNAINAVSSTAKKHGIKRIKFITLEIGADSTFVPAFFEKLFPVAVDGMDLFKSLSLRQSNPVRKLFLTGFFFVLCCFFSSKSSALT